MPVNDVFADWGRFVSLVEALQQLQRHNQQHAVIAKQMQEENATFEFPKLWVEMFLNP